MNFKLITCTFITALFAFTSCKKTQEEPVIEYPFTLENSTVEKKSEIQLFTSNQELKDVGKITKFVENSQLFNMHLQDNRFGSLTVFSADSSYFNFPENKYTYEKKNGLYYFYSTYLYDLGDAPAGSLALVKHKEPHFNTAQGVMAKEIRVAKGTLKSLEFSCLAYKLSRNSYNVNGKLTGSTEEEGVLYNEFNEDFLRSLGEHDTLAVQKFVITVK
ncbi:hypothetical protein [Desertivirga brevis]|uniref:hypothetical protein n=1 Tax=Desertivirga brevis TaxID=2810310 RepID=UPI001A9581AE|nr:hypothetical protein [Pedobacter sp. SYSU D00873]